MGNTKSTPYQRRQESSEPVQRRTKISRDHADFFPTYSISSQYPHEYSDPIRFNEVHGMNITISEGGKVASRTNSFCYAIAFTSRPIGVEERVRIRLRRIDGCWSGVMRFGFTSKDPSALHPRNLPRYACPDLTDQEGYWAKALPPEFAEQNNILTFYVTSAGSVIFAINNQQQGIIFDGVDVSSSVWGLFDIYGNTTSLEFLDREEVESISPRQSLGLEIGLPEGPVQLPANMLRSAKIRLQVSDPITPICFSATMGHGLKCRNRTHLTAKRNFVDSTVAFTNTALNPGQTAYFYCAEANSDAYPLVEFMSFGIGVTTCNPTSVPIHELPFDAMMLLDRPEYWVFFRDFEAPEQGEYFALSVEKGGFLSYHRSRVGKTVLFHMDTTQPLYLALDLGGKVTSVAIIGMSTEPSYPGEDDQPTSCSRSPSFIDVLNNETLEGLEFFDRSPILGISFHQEIDPDIPGTSMSRASEMEIPDNVASIGSSDAHGDSVPAGVYPHETPSSGVSKTAMAVAAAPMVVSALSWLGQRVADRLGSNEVEMRDSSGEESDNEVREEVFHNARGELDSSSSSDDSNLEMKLQHSVRVLESLRGDLDEILRPISLLDVPQGAVGGSPRKEPSSHIKVPISEATPTKPNELPISKDKDSDTTETVKECVICFDNPVNAVIYTCGHACLCYECGTRLKKSPQRSCPICRAKVKDVIRMYQA